MNLSASRGDQQTVSREMEGDRTMMIVALAAAMTLAMLIATAIGLHQESQRVTLERKRIDARRNRF